MDDLISQVESLKLKVKALEDKNISLEEECDLLASANHTLTQELNLLKQTIPSVSSYSNPASKFTSKDEIDIIIEGDGDYVKSQLVKIDAAAGGLNVLCVCFARSSDDEPNDIIICGGADKSIRSYSLSGQHLATINLSAPVLSLDAHLSLVAFSCMDGVHGFFDTGGITKPHIEQKHSKYVVCIRWSTTGKYLATASYDKSVNIFSFKYPETILLKTLSLIDSPESLAFSQSGDTEELIIGIRDTAYVIYFDCTSFTQTRVSLNENDWDTHCSFTALYLDVSLDNSMLLVASDKHLHYVYKLKTNRRIATLAGHTCSEYGRPRCVFDYSGKYIYSNSELDNSLHIYSLASKKIVHSIRGHGGLVKDISRGICGGPSAHCVVSCSYDKAVIVWTPEIIESKI